MELSPYVPILAPPTGLTPGASILAIIEDVLPDGKAVTRLPGLLLQLPLPMPVKPGDAVHVKVQQATAQATWLEIAPLDPKQILQRLDLPIDRESEDVVRALLRMNAPMERERVEAAIAAVRSAKGDARADAAAFLVKHGVEPDPEIVTSLARLAEPPPPVEPATAPLLREMNVAPREDAKAPPLPRMDAVRELLDRSIVLRFLDRAIGLTSTTPPDPDAPPQNLVRVIQVIQDFLEHPDEAAFARFRDALRLPLAQLRDLRARLLEMEHSALSTLPQLAEAREARGTVFEIFDRALAHRLVTQLSTISNDGVAIFEVPVRHEGRVVHVPIRVIRREGGKASAEAGFHVTIDTDLSRLGPVRTRLDVAGRAMGVKFSTRDDEARRHLEGGAGELAAALRELGWTATIGAEVAPARGENPFELFQSPSNYLGLDVRA